MEYFHPHARARDLYMIRIFFRCGAWMARRKLCRKHSQLSGCRSRKSNMSGCQTKMGSRVHENKPKSGCPRLVWTGGGTSASRVTPKHSPKAVKSKAWRGRLHHMLLNCLFLLCCLSCHLVPCQSQTCNQTQPCYSAMMHLAHGQGASVSVSSTCGTSGRVDYMTLLSSATFQCDATNATISHPKEYMVDFTTETIPSGTVETPNAQTYWQSEIGGALPQWVELNLTNAYLVRYISILFVAPHVESMLLSADLRPKSLVIEAKFSQSDTEWTAWRYYAEDCAASWPGIQIRTTPGQFGPTTAVCVQAFFGGDVATDLGSGFGQQVVSETISCELNYI